MARDCWRVILNCQKWLYCKLNLHNKTMKNVMGRHMVLCVTQGIYSTRKWWHTFNISGSKVNAHCARDTYLIHLSGIQNNRNTSILLLQWQDAYETQDSTSLSQQAYFTSICVVWNKATLGELFSRQIVLASVQWLKHLFVMTYTTNLTQN